MNGEGNNVNGGVNSINEGENTVNRGKKDWQLRSMYCKLNMELDGWTR